MNETLSSFWKKLQLGTKIKVTYTDHYRNKTEISFGNIVLVQSNAAARDGSQGDILNKHTKEKPCFFRKPKASECEITENKLIEKDQRCSTTVIYEILEDNN